MINGLQMVLSGVRRAPQRRARNELSEMEHFGYILNQKYCVGPRVQNNNILV